MTSDSGPSLEERVEGLLRDHATDNSDLVITLQALYDRYCTQTQMLDRLTQISDKYHRAERDRSLSYADQLQRKVRQVEKIVRISDGYQAMLQDFNARLTQISTHDELTGLPNRRHAQDRLKQAIAHCERNDEAFSIAMVDIDYFKKFNDSGGHDVGDIVLARIAKCLLGCMREYDLCARWGGEEFLLLFSSCDLEHAALLAERVRVAVVDLDHADLPPGTKLSVSIGFAQFQLGENIDAALKRADNALYQAKSEGRNRVIAAS